MATKTDIAGMATKTDIANSEKRIVSWLVGTIITVGGLAVTVAGFFF